MNNQRVIIIIINVFQVFPPDSSQPVAYTQRSMKRPSVTRWSKGCARVRADKSAANCTQWCHGTLDFSPFTFWLLHRGSFSPEGETNRRSCAVHADNYLRSLPPYCFLNNRLPISISWLLAWLRAFLFQAPRVLLRSCLSKGCMRIRGYCSRLLQQGELIFYRTEKSLSILREEEELLRHVAYILIRFF